MNMPTLIRPEPVAPASREPKLAYLLLRLLTGLDFFGHGYARTFTGSYLPGFAASMQKSMASAPLSPELVLWIGYVIPVVEIVIGALLLLGVFTRQALVLAFLLLFVLMFGVTMKQDWNAAGQQLMYGLVLFVLLLFRERYDCSWAGFFHVERPRF
jgi:thiosulfate dehydrogenase [quinone] large subunit